MWWTYALLAALFASLTALFAKMGVASVPSNLATAVRTVVILFIAWGVVLFKGETRELLSISRQGLFFLVLSGVTTGLSWLFYFKALQLGKVSQVAPVDKLSVALTILLAAVFLQEPLTLKTALAAGLIIAGTLILIF
jgi:transporter family protein